MKIVVTVKRPEVDWMGWYWWCVRIEESIVFVDEDGGIAIDCYLWSRREM